MPLALVTGPANAAKAGHVLDAVRALSGRGPLLVVPTLEDVVRYERELAQGSTVLGGRVVRFDGLLEEVARRAGYAARVLGRVARRRLMRRAVAEARLVALAESAAGPGFADAALELVADLERSLVDPPRFAAALRTWAGGRPGLAEQARELGAIVLGYRRGLERAGAVDGDLFARRALDALRERPAAWGATPVLLYGYDDLTALQRDAVETLARICDAPVTVALAHEAGHPAFAGRARTTEELRPLADEVVELPDRDGHYAPAARAALHHVERRLFGPPGEDPPDPAGAVEVLEAGGERAELELVAGRIRELMADGVAPERIAVVLRSPRRAAALVGEVLGAYGVPHRVAAAVPLGHTALGRGLLGAARAVLAPDAPAAELLAWLRAPGVLDDPSRADDLERRARRAGAVDAARARRLWEERHWPLDRLSRLEQDAATGPTALLDAVEREARRLFERPRRRQAAQVDPGGLVDARALGAVRDALDQLRTLLEADPAAAPTAVELLDELAAVEVRLDAEPGAGGVQVADPLSIRARRFHAVFACGLVEGQWPPPARPDPFLDDERRRELNAATGLRLALRDHGPEEERYAFYACVSRPEALLVLSHRSSDEEGNPVTASPLLEDVRDLFADRLAAQTTIRPLAEVTWSADAAPTARERARAWAAGAHAGEPRPLGSLRQPASLARVAAQAACSAGQVETYASCPVKWFVERHLRPAALDPDAEPLRRGDVAHRTLAATTRRLARETGSGRITAATLPDARRILAEELDLVAAAEPLHHDPARNAGLARRLRGDLLRFVEREAACPGAWEPRWVELPFGGAGDEGWDPAVREGEAAPSLGPLELGGGEVRLRGVIDRVDVDPAGAAAVVRDFKLSTGFPRARWAEGGQVQMAVYLLAVDRLLGLRPVAGLYQPLTAPELRPRGIVRGDPAAGGLEQAGCYATDVVDEAEWDECLAWAEEFVLEQVRGMRAGRLDARPDTCAWRGGCAYPGVCRSVPA